MELRHLGWSAYFEAAFAQFAAVGFVPARVILQHRGAFRVRTVHGELAAEVSGHFRRGLTEVCDFPAVGDWVAIESLSDSGKAVIHGVLPRRTKFSRTAAGKHGGEQIVAANIDDLFIVTAPNSSLNLRRVERYLALAWESGANPVLLLAKADVCEDLAADIEKLTAVVGSVPVVPVSSVTGFGFKELAVFISIGRTSALVGPSGVGKSTLVNRLCGEEMLKVQKVREWDQKGRHTTSHRQLVLLPTGGLIVDTPGMRELRLWEGAEGISETFDDIEELAVGCRFSDCRHETEPGCSVREAVESGIVDRGRLESYRKLKRELEHFGRKYDKRSQSEQRKRWSSATKALRIHTKAKR